MNQDNELYHHGVPGMKWGKRKANYNTSTSSKNKTTKTNKSKKTTKTKRKTEDITAPLKEYQKKTVNTYKIRYAGIGAKLAGVALSNIGTKTYNKYKDDGTPAAAAVVNGAMMTSKALNTIGDVTIATSYAKQFKDWGDYLRS